jgi:hypothetical protein
VEDVGAKVPALERAGTKALDEHVGLGGEPLHERLPLGRAEVESDGPLVAADHLPPERRPALLIAVVADRIVGLRMLDLDDVGPEVGQHRGGQRAGEERRGLEDPQAGQRTVLTHRVAHGIGSPGCAGAARGRGRPRGHNVILSIPMQGPAERAP